MEGRHHFLMPKRETRICFDDQNKFPHAAEAVAEKTGAMFDIMARENLEGWSHDPSVLQETIRVFVTGYAKGLWSLRPEKFDPRAAYRLAPGFTPVTEYQIRRSHLIPTTPPKRSGRRSSRCSGRSRRRSRCWRSTRPMSYPRVSRRA